MTDIVPTIAHAIGGSLGSAMALALLYPLERIKIEMQTRAQDNNDYFSNTNSSSSCLYETTSQDDDSILHCFFDLIRRNELYKGVGPLAVTLATSSFVFFYINEYLKRQIANIAIVQTKQRQHAKTLLLSSSSLKLLASCVAGIGNVLVTNPLWVANLRIVTGASDSTSLITEIVHIAQTQGILQLWKGTASSILLVSNPVIQFYCYEQLKNWQLSAVHCSSSNNNSANLKPLQAFATGALAKTIATVLTYPLQLTQALLRLQKNSSSSNNNYKGILDCLIKLYIQNGLPGLFTGLRAKLLQTVLTAAFTFLTYEQIMRVVTVVILTSRRKKKTV